MAAKFRTEQGFNIAGSVDIVQGSTAPEHAVIANIGSMYMNNTTGSLYRKNADSGANTGWVQLADQGGSSTEDTYQNTFTGKTLNGSELPTYSTDNVVTQGASLETAIGELDLELSNATLNTDTNISANAWVKNSTTLAEDSDFYVPTQKAVKAYVDAVTTSEMTYKGAYDAATNTPDLDTTPGTINIGDMYTVTVEGAFYSTTVQVGDVLIAEVANASTEAEWTIVQKDTDMSAYLTDATNVAAAGAVMESDYDANTILAATTDNTPVTLTVGEQTLVGRTTGNDIAALTGSDVRTIINVEDGADVTDATNVEASGAVMKDEVSTVDMDFVIDDDTMANASATKIATSESTKAYVDTSIAGLLTPVNDTLDISVTTEVDSILSSGIVAVEWEIVLWETATPANMYSCKVFAHTHGSASDSVEYAVLELGTSPDVTVTVTPGTNLILNIKSSVASTCRVNRRVVNA
jgi:hypothetical protein